MVFFLHWHSNVSDGTYSPEYITRHIESVRKTFERFKQCRGFAITDHDNVEGVIRAKKTLKELGSDLVLVPGVEFSFSKWVKGRWLEGEMLGYGIYPEYEGLQKVIESSKKARDERNHLLIELLGKDYPNITLENIKEFIGKRRQINRNDIADFIMYVDIATQKRQAFDIILKCELKRKKTPLEEVAQVIHDAGGVCILPHGGLFLQYNNISEDFYVLNVLPMLLEYGLKGHELYPYAKRGRMTTEESKECNEFFSDLNELENGLIDNIWGEDAHFDWLDKDDIDPGSFPTEDGVVKELLLKCSRYENFKNENNI